MIMITAIYDTGSTDILIIICKWYICKNLLIRGSAKLLRFVECQLGRPSCASLKWLIYMKTGLSWELLGHPCCLSLGLCRLGPRLLTDGPGLRFLRVILVSRWFSPHVQCLRFKGKTLDFIRFYISVTRGYYGHQRAPTEAAGVTYLYLESHSWVVPKRCRRVFPGCHRWYFPHHFMVVIVIVQDSKTIVVCCLAISPWERISYLQTPESTSPLENALDSTSEAIWHGYTIPSCSFSKHFAGSTVQPFSHILHLGIACRLWSREVQEYYPDDVKLVLSARCGCDHGWGRQKSGWFRYV